MKWITRIGVGCAIGYLSYQQNHTLEVTQIPYHNPNIPPSFHGYRILHISDLHNMRFGKAQHKLIAKIKEIKPELIVITGDIIDRKKTNQDNLQPLYDFITNLKDNYLLCYIPGNHEATSYLYPYIRNYLMKQGVHVLENRAMKLIKKDEEIIICGIMDPKFYPHPEADYMHHLTQLSKYTATRFCMLLAHHPEYFEAYVQHQFDLVFCGHAHGGQFRIPNVGGVYSPDQGFLPSYSEGSFTKKHTTMVVSRGLGNSRMPQRLNNLPQLVLVTLYR